MSMRIHGRPGHLIVEQWPDDDPTNDNAFERHEDSIHAEDARKIYNFFSHYVSFEETVRRLYYRLKDEMPWWDEKRQAWEREHDIEREEPNED